MDHSLEDTLNLESTIGDMDFESSDVVVNQSDINLDAGPHDGDMAMEFVPIVEQPSLMDSGNEEIIVSDFMEDQFNLQEYSIQDDQTSGRTTVEDSNQELSVQSENLIDLQYSNENLTQLKSEAQDKLKFISIRAATPVRPSTSKKPESTVLATVPRQVAIAPKPPRLVPVASNRFIVPPKPVALVTKKAAGFVKKVPFSSFVQGGSKGVLAQIGKQLVMMPSGSGQKIKVVSANNAGLPTVQLVKAASDQAQLIPNKNTSGPGNKPVIAKLIQVPGQSDVDPSNQPAVITRILPTSTPNLQQTRYIMQSKTMPISVGNKVIMASPTSKGVKFTKKHEIISIKAPSPKLMPAPATSTGPTTAKKVVISANPSQNVILKTTAPPNAAQVNKDGKLIVQGQRSQIHQINVPGKGIQYIRLITNANTTTSKTVTKTQVTTVNAPLKTIVLSDGKGPQKLMRIAPAPVTVKPVSAPQLAVRSKQSLLAPLSPVDMEESMEQSQAEAGAESNTQREEAMKRELFSLDRPESLPEEEEIDSKAALRDLLAQAQNQPQSPEGPDVMENTEISGDDRPDHPLIVISAANFISQEHSPGQDTQYNDNSRALDEDQDGLHSINSPKSPPGDSDVLTGGELAFKPRRACNCTKSQCLKLYCDCFANGEFCNRCNCNNCHNNLDHEDLRQRAIRACLERNPNAFRPKIGKTKNGGPEIIRRHNKGCNCKRSGCLKNYCECYEAKIACTAMCRCVGCRNVEDGLSRRRPPPLYRAHAQTSKQPCTFMTSEVIDAVCQCLLAAASPGGDPDAGAEPPTEPEPMRDVLDEFGRCLQEIIGASHFPFLDQGRA